ncbi:Na+/H+ antiporter [Saccharibacillus kuerlensis]|uniref:Sodium, potassium, lithium and rubidium/H(+) antiporter n=1 Tax=Saccharibacillus kuerlensis TaxID=459527 RepID=A0ABQ2L4Y3_9BACL|nr:Na+/H+ antiporter [Saccharibacillus kuerlensis]GGO03112.1 sodium, potassium, lithium and rubidium/H(+) antiporter [Saccharibacillus kuerlensis]
MELFISILVMLAIIGLSNVINRFLPFIPVPLVQIGLGVMAQILPPHLHVPLEPELFLVLFIAPLLFNDGRMTPRQELWNLRAPILLLALGLVFVTVIMFGYLIHWVIPSIPLAAAFALAAILSPTDAVAVGSLAGRIKLPKDIMRLLEGEALVNDASGLVAFKFAVAAAVTGTFSIYQASLSFVLIAVGGLLVGAALAFVIIRIRVFLRRFGMEDETLHVLIQLVTPFVLYLVAEHLGLSGILAAVSGGVVHAIERDRAESVRVKLQVVSSSTWSVFLYVLNGLVFVLLGLQLPEVLGAIFADPAVSSWGALWHVTWISVGLIVLRFVWIYVYWLSTNHGSGAGRTGIPLFKAAVQTALSGVRGAVTLAGAFSIPLMLAGGTAFPERNLILFLAAGVILFTLLAGSILLPMISGNEQAESPKSEQPLKRRILSAIAQRLGQEDLDEGRSVAASEIQDFTKYLQRMEEATNAYAADPEAPRREADLMYAGIRAQRRELSKMVQNGEVDQEEATPLFEHLSRIEENIPGRLEARVATPAADIGRFAAALFARNRRGELKNKQAFCSLQTAKTRMAQSAIEAIEKRTSDENRAEAKRLIDGYNQLIGRLGKASFGLPDEETEEEREEREHRMQERLAAIQEQRDHVQRLFEKGEISRDLAGRLRQFIRYLETDVPEEENFGH